MRMQVKLEIGHKAACRVEPTQEGYTHDWTVFVRGSEGKEISHFVEKVVFHLHESFPRHKRAVKEPPYKLDERGYGSFELKIEVCFKTRDEPRKVMFTYDLFLPLIGYPPVTNVRTEALTFTHPTEDFMKKLIKGGGLQITASNGVSSNGISNGHGNVSRDESKEAAQKSSSVPDSDKSKKTKSLKPNSKSGAASGAVVGMKRLPPSHDHTSTDGTAKKKKKPSSENSSSKSKHSVPVPNDKASSTSLPLATEVKDVKVKFKAVAPKESEKKDHSLDNSNHKGKTPTHSSKGKELKSHTEHASGTDNKTKGETIEHQRTKIKKKGEKPEKPEKPERKSHSEKKEKKEKDKKIVDKVTIRRGSGDSWASSGSSGGLMSNVTSKNKALEKMLSEMSDEEDEGENLATPFKREMSPALPKTSPKSASKEQSSVGATEKAGSLNSSKHKSKENKPRLNNANAYNSSEKHALNGTKEHCTSGGTEADVDAKKSTDDVKSSPPAKNEEKNGLSGLSKKELCDLYEQIMNCEDSDNLQKVVDVIENTGLYKVSDKTFEFDLCCLEKVTLRKIQKCLASR